MTSLVETPAADGFVQLQAVDWIEGHHLVASCMWPKTDGPFRASSAVDGNQAAVRIYRANGLLIASTTQVL